VRRPGSVCRIRPSSPTRRLSPCKSWGFSVSAPIAKYSSCFRAHDSQKDMPPIFTAASRRQGSSVPLRTWHDPSSFVALVNRPSFTRRIPTFVPFRFFVIYALPILCRAAPRLASSERTIMATQMDDSCHAKTQAGARTPNSYQALGCSEATLGDLQRG